MNDIGWFGQHPHNQDKGTADERKETNVIHEYYNRFIKSRCRKTTSATCNKDKTGLIGYDAEELFSTLLPRAATSEPDTFCSVLSCDPAANNRRLWTPTV